MRKLKEVLRLKFDRSLSNRPIAKSANVSPGTVSYYVRAFNASGLNWEDAQHQSDDALSERLRPFCQQFREPNQLARFPIEYEAIHNDLKRKGVTLQLLWEEYKQACPVDKRVYSYPQYCRYYCCWRRKLRPKYREHYIGGEKCFVDYAGPKVPIYNSETGEIQLHASIFVGILAASNYTFAVASASHSIPDWLECHVKMFEFFGGVSQLVIPDNEKAGVNKASYYEPELNPQYAALAYHYNTTILPTRPAKPRDKGKVECAVLVVERWILARLRKLRLFSLAELNGHIASLLAELNKKPFQKLSGCRESVYLQLDKPALIALPGFAFEYVDIQRTKVDLSYHIHVNDHSYSVPCIHMHKTVEYRLTRRVLEVFYQGVRIASHARDDRPGLSSTLTEHMPEAHRQHALWTPESFKLWAKDIGTTATKAANHIINNQPHPECCYRIHSGLRKLVRLYGEVRFEAACDYALATEAVSYKSLSSILKNQLEKTSPPGAVTKIESPAPKHGNVRGAAYYSKPTHIVH